MKFTILGFSQEKAIEYSLDIKKLLILRWFIDFMPKMESKKLDKEVYYWISYEKVIEELPILKIESKAGIYKKLKELVDKGILKHKEIRVGGTFSYYALGEKYNELVEQTSKNVLTTIVEDFNKIWELYPRKDNKNTAFKHYRQWLKGKEYAGKIERLTNRQMWFAVKKYANQIKENKTEKQYIKMGSTFFNGAIFEYVD